MPRLFCSKGENPFFPDCYQCSSSAGVLTAGNIVEQNQWKNSAQKKLQRLVLEFLHTEEDFFLAVTHALFPIMFLCFTFAQTSQMVGEVVSISST